MDDDKLAPPPPYGEFVESDPDPNQQQRAEGMAILATMPEWWKDQFREVAREHYGSRRGRRATAKLLREYGTWLATTARIRALQASAKGDRRLDLLARVANREALGKGLPMGATQDHVDAAMASLPPAEVVYA